MREVHVAIVDDDESLCRSLSRFVVAAGLNPACYVSADDYLADDERGRFDCLIVDVQLNGMSGIDLAARLFAEGAGIPIIFISSHDRAEWQDQLSAIPGAIYLQKTSSGDTVLAAIRQVIRQNLVDNVLAVKSNPPHAPNLKP